MPCFIDFTSHPFFSATLTLFSPAPGGSRVSHVSIPRHCFRPGQRQHSRLELHPPPPHHALPLHLLLVTAASEGEADTGSTVPSLRTVETARVGAGAGTRQRHIQPVSRGLTLCKEAVQSFMLCEIQTLKFVCIWQLRACGGSTDTLLYFALLILCCSNYYVSI